MNHFPRFPLPYPESHAHATLIKRELAVYVINIGLIAVILILTLADDLMRAMSNLTIAAESFRSRLEELDISE